MMEKYSYYTGVNTYVGSASLRGFRAALVVKNYEKGGSWSVVKVLGFGNSIEEMRRQRDVVLAAVENGLEEYDRRIEETCDSLEMLKLTIFLHGLSGYKRDFALADAIEVRCAGRLA